MNHRWVAVYRYYINCPSCEGADGTPRLVFFKSIKEIIKYAMDNFGDGEIGDVYSVKTGYEKDNICFSYECSRHNVVGLSIRLRNKKYRTYDDGSGKLLLQDTETAKVLFGKK